MTIFYSKSTNFFYSDQISPVAQIPKDAIEITEDQHQNLLVAQMGGKTIQPDENGNPEAVSRTYTKAQIIAQYEADAQSNLDSVAKSWGYDSLVSAASYSNSTNPQYKAEAEALIEWRDAYWSEAYTIEADTLPPTSQAFVALLPAAPTKPNA